MCDIYRPQYVIEEMTWEYVVKLLRIQITEKVEPDFTIIKVYLPTFKSKCLFQISNIETEMYGGYKQYLIPTIIHRYNLEQLLSTKIKIT